MEQSKLRVESEPIKYTDYVGMQARMLLNAANLDPTIPLNITTDQAKTRLANTSDLKNSVHLVAGLIGECSAETRLKANEGKSYDEAMQAWLESVVKTVKTHGAKHQRALTKLGWNPTLFTLNDAQALYNRFTEQNTTQSLVEKFVKETLDLYKDKDAAGNTIVEASDLEEDLASWQWLAGIFGAEEAEMATNLLKGYLFSLLEKRRAIFAQDAPSKVNALSPREIHLLQKLSDKQKLVVAPAAAEADILPPRSTVEGLLKTLTAPVDKTQPFYVDSVPKSLSHESLGSLGNLGITDSYFVTLGSSLVPNPQVAPWDKALRIEGKDPRYEEALGLVEDESDLLALCAVSAENPQEQARLYHLLANLVVGVHSNQPGLRDEWQNNQNADTRQFLQIFDQDILNAITESAKRAGRTELNEQEKEARLNNTLVNLPESSARAIWQSRLAQLQQALKTGQLAPHHLRWIEFLSHSVNINQVIKLLQPQEVTSAPLIDQQEEIKTALEAHPEFTITFAEAMSSQARQERNLYYTNQAAFRDWISRARKRVQEGQKTNNSWFNEINITRLDGSTRPLIINTLPGENGWFSSGAFTEMATEYGIPMGLFIPGGHAMGLLKVLSHQEENGKLSLELLVYNPMTGVEEVDISRDLRQKNSTAQVEVIDRDIFNVIKITVDQTEPQWYDNLTQLGLCMSQPGLELLKKGEFDLSLQGDPLLVANEALAKAKSGAYQLGSDVYNCIPYSFLVSTIRAAMKYHPDDPNMPEEYRAMYEHGLANFAKDWEIERVGTDGKIHSQPFRIATRADLEALPTL